MSAHYARLLAHYPYAVVGMVALVSVTCLIITFTAQKLPEFKNPSDVGAYNCISLYKGFEARGTEISNRLVTWQNMKDATTRNPSIGLLSAMPLERSAGAWTVYNNSAIHRKTRSLDEQGFFCEGSPGAQYSRLVLQGADASEDLFSLQPLLSMCHLDLRLRSISEEFSNICVLSRNDTCCRSWTLANYVAAHGRRASCLDITEADVSQLRDLALDCADYYYNGTLAADCYRTRCAGVPAVCGAAYEVLHYVVDVAFVESAAAADSSSPAAATYAMMFLPVATGIGVRRYYGALAADALRGKGVAVVALEFGLKYELFQEYLKSDTVFVAAASGSVFVFVWLYTRSLFITTMMAVAMAFSLVIAYFFYSMIFELAFFPFVNLLAVVLVVALGADDVFIYAKIWSLAKSEKNNGVFEKIIVDTLAHATRSMFVSSLTTAAALYASYVSAISALRCFSVFAGTAVLVNFFFMVTWLPACFIIHDKWVSSRIFFEKLLPFVVVKGRLVWLLLFGAAAAGSCVVIFYKPRLSLPNVDYFQFFDSLNPFEVYDFKFRDVFGFEKCRQEGGGWQLPIKVVWGVQPADNGDHLDPYSTGTLQFDSSFDLMHHDSQVWLLEFCTQLRNQTFYKPSFGPQLTDCFMQKFANWMKKPCIALDESDSAPCCRASAFPFSRSVFTTCLERYMTSLQNTPTYDYHRGVGGLRFDVESGDVRAVILEFDSAYAFTFKYEPMHEFFERVESWVAERMASAPPSLRNGWFVSELAFYDLQRTLSSGTLTAIAVSIAVACLVLFVTTLNVLVTLCAIAAIAGVIFATIAALTLLGWQLNVLESSTLTVAVGLAADFTLHYVVAYRRCGVVGGGGGSGNAREAGVVFALAHVGSPVALAAFSTLVAGALLLPSRVLAYQQLGVFLIVIAAVSWTFATLLLLSQHLRHKLRPPGHVAVVQPQRKAAASCAPTLLLPEEGVTEEAEEPIDGKQLYDDEGSGVWVLNKSLV
ncbi:PREDICTED: protein dispatched homolog 1-like [Priapulus caudatus]|uniref:Protein dispatched homolog 1-like n=1 Tax=Priapulus caudatus TaxID=37621 RepID=A0ABM1DYM8_PRICU|nr:PREDICTED: protein dispatched homolog 1-like [Priapulus caudatus]